MDVASIACKFLGEIKTAYFKRATATGLDFAVAIGTLSSSRVPTYQSKWKLPSFRLTKDKEEDDRNLL
jgi:hypothetical protein